nr:hypothetical protein [Algoriphagus aestuariicola]
MDQLVPLKVMLLRLYPIMDSPVELNRQVESVAVEVGYIAKVRVLAAELVSFHLPVFESFPKHPLSWCEPLPL